MLYIKSLEIDNVRCFHKKQRIDFTCENGKISQWTVILGDNGTGKTTLLRSLVSLLPAPSDFLDRRSHLDTEYEPSINTAFKGIWSLNLPENEKASCISLIVAELNKGFNEDIKLEIKLQYTTDTEVELYNKVDTKLFSPVYCFAYGANRKMGSKSLSGENILQTSQTLFDDEALLPNSEEYFLQLDYETAKNKKGNQELNRVKQLLLRILPEGVKDIKVVRKARLIREVHVHTPYGWVPLTELSLGYKTTIAWLVDFATKMIYYHGYSNEPFERPAILIIDEIDLHMHPAWQREIIDNLTKVFPKVQFIVTAHSPLIAQAALDSNLILLRKFSNYVKVINDPAVIRSWRIDQVLTSDLFGLKYSRPKEIEHKMKRRRLLLKKSELTPSQKSELQKLNEQIDNLPIGDTKAEIDAIEILKDFAEKINTSKRKND